MTLKDQYKQVLSEMAMTKAAYRKGKKAVQRASRARGDGTQRGYRKADAAYWKTSDRFFKRLASDKVYDVDPATGKLIVVAKLPKGGASELGAAGALDMPMGTKNRKQIVKAAKDIARQRGMFYVRSPYMDDEHRSVAVVGGKRPIHRAFVRKAKDSKYPGAFGE